MKLRWTPHSRDDLRAIYDYIAQDSTLNATHMIDRLTRREAQIVSFPRAGRVVPEYAREDVREIIERPYRIIYRILPDRIDVLSVMHGARILREIPGVKIS